MAEQICDVRRAGSAESEIVSQVLAAVFGDDVEQQLGHSFSKILGTPDEHVFVAFVDEQPIGCILASGAGRAVLHTLGVIEAFRSHHHGTTLIETAMAWLSENDPAVAFTAAVDARNAADCDRFLRLGFEKISHTATENAGIADLVILNRDVSIPASVESLGEV